MADDDAEALCWLIPWEGETYEWRGVHDLTVRRLRHFKSWYGSDYGKVNSFNLLFFQGDVDAVACVIWAVLKEHNRAPNTPNDLPDFSVGGLTSATILKGADVDPPEPDDAPAATNRSSTRTSKSSAPPGSDT